MSFSINYISAAIGRIHRDAVLLFDEAAVPDGMTPPRVTLDLPSTDPEPFHVFTWGTAREFGVAGFLSGNVIMLTFRIRMTIIASGSTPGDAARMAGDYLVRALQISLCDTQLGGAVTEVGLPQIVSSDAWADQSGRRHAGYLIEFECSRPLAADPSARSILQEVHDHLEEEVVDE